VFEIVSEISNTKSKKFFLEKINIYIRLIEVFADSLNLKLDKNNYQINSETFIRLSELNILNSKLKDDNKLLIKVLKQNLYRKFISTINFNIKYKKKIGNLLNKLDPSKRKIIRKEVGKKKKYSVVDFFCGAGGLSHGFAQEGFIIDLANDNDEECIETYKFNHPEIFGKKILLEDIKKVKYVTDVQPGYVFNMDTQDWTRKFVIVTEGPFDAITVSGVSILGSEINDTQRELINNLNRQVIVVPDRDAPGEKLITQAIEFGWSVAFPEWDKTVGDVAEAVLKYGRLFTIQSILKSTESSKLKIDLKRKIYG